MARTRYLRKRAVLCYVALEAFNECSFDRGDNARIFTYTVVTQYLSENTGVRDVPIRHPILSNSHVA